MLHFTLIQTKGLELPGVGVQVLVLLPKFGGLLELDAGLLRGLLLMHLNF